MRQTQVPVTNGLRPPRRNIDVLFLSVRFKNRRVRIDGWMNTRASFGARKISFPESGQHKKIERTPITDQRQINHGLSQLILAVDIFDHVGLIDNIYQVLRFGHAPEHNVEADGQLPIIRRVHPFQFTDVEMSPLVITLIDARKRNKCKHVPSIVCIGIKFRPSGNG